MFSGRDGRPSRRIRSPDLGAASREKHVCSVSREHRSISSGSEPTEGERQALVGCRQLCACGCRSCSGAPVGRRRGSKSEYDEQAKLSVGGGGDHLRKADRRALPPPTRRVVNNMVHHSSLRPARGAATRRALLDVIAGVIFAPFLTTRHTQPRPPALGGDELPARAVGVAARRAAPPHERVDAVLLPQPRVEGAHRRVGRRFVALRVARLGRVERDEVDVPKRRAPPCG